MKTISFFLFILISSSRLFAQTYVDSLATSRKEHLAELKDTANHILNSEEVNSFKGLDYFPVDTAYKITAKFKKKLGPEFEMPTSGTRTPVYRRYGYLYFEVNHKKCRLTVYQNIQLSKSEDLKDYLFVPFRDLTSSHATYGGGRYLDFEIPETKEILIDFNLAYNPYCAYSHRYSCPIPPAENTLSVEILAGEKYIETVH